MDAQGRIKGIRATESFVNTIAGFAIAISAVDPMSLIFALSSSLGVFRLPDSSILLPTGAELKFEFGVDLAVDSASPAQFPTLSGEGAKSVELSRIVQALPYRTATEAGGAPSDLTNLVYTGSQEAIRRAFQAAGWVRSDELDIQSTYGVMRSIEENQGCKAAPMSMLLLDGKKPTFTFAKTLSTFFSRHHLRIYPQAGTYQGNPVWTSTATYDSGIGFSKSAKTFIHLINEHIDEERSKVINDLMLTGCVSGVGYLERPWVPKDAKNATGDALITDGRIAVVELNDCTNPIRANEPAKDMPVVQAKQGAFFRPFRAAVLTLRNDLTRGNIGYQAYSGTRMLLKVAKKGDAPTGAGPKTFSYGGQEFSIVEGARKPNPKLCQQTRAREFTRKWNGASQRRM